MIIRVIAVAACIVLAGCEVQKAGGGQVIINGGRILDVFTWIYAGYGVLMVMAMCVGIYADIKAKKEEKS